MGAPAVQVPGVFTAPSPWPAPYGKGVQVPPVQHSASALHQGRAPWSGKSVATAMKPLAARASAAW